MSSIFLAGLFFWVQVAGAVTPQKNKKVGVDYLKETFNEAKKKNSKSFLSEVYEQHRGFFPYELRRELDYRIKKQNPNLPTPEVEAVNQGKNKIIRVRFKEGKNNITLQMTEPNTYELLGSINGKAIRQKFTKDDFVDPLVFLKKMTGIKRTITRSDPSVEMMNAYHISQLTEDQKKSYVDKLRATLEAAEKVQVELASIAKKNPKKKALYLLFTEVANAASPSGSCIAAGWAGQYENGSCQPPREAFLDGNQAVSCNPSIYGQGHQIAISGNRISPTATRECNDKTKDDKYVPFYGIKNQEDFNTRQGEVLDTIRGLDEACAEVKSSGEKSKLPDQAPTCTTFEGRLKDLKDATCEPLSKNKEKFPGLTCAGKEPPEAPPMTPPGTEEEEVEQPEPPPEPAQDDGCPLGDAKMCKGITQRATQASCGSGELKCVSCPGTGGKTVRKGYCECAPGTERKQNSVYAHACEEAVEEAPVRGADRSYDDEERPRRKRRDSGFLGLGMQNWLALALVGLAGYYAFTQFGNAQANKPPDPVWPRDPVPPPQTGPVLTPSGTTIPVINTR